MTVGELIRELQKFPPELAALVECGECMDFQITLVAQGSRLTDVPLRDGSWFKSEPAVYLA